MIDFKPVTLESKDEINSYYKKENITSSEMNFTTLYIWQKAYDIQYCMTDGCMVVRFRDNGNPPSLRVPVGDGDVVTAFKKSCKCFLEQGHTPKFYGVTESKLKWVEENFPDMFTVTPTRDYFDYIYKSEDLISLKGKRYHSKKNHFNGFIRAYEDYELSDITPDDYNEIMERYSKWGTIDDRYLEAEYESIGNLIKNIDTLVIMGAKLRVNGEICAFTFGERLNSNTAVVHIEKADTSYKGAYAAINKLFAENYLYDFEYINREEDCGIEGLRKAKLSYNPAGFTEKYCLILKEDYNKEF